MSDSKYLQEGFEKQLSHVIEECGEFLAAAGKTQRWGPRSTNPELLPSERETNIDWIMRELEDLELAIARLKYTVRYKGVDS